MYSGGGCCPERLPYTQGRASGRLVDVLSTFQSSGGFGGVFRVLPLAAASLLLGRGRVQDLMLARI